MGAELTDVELAASLVALGFPGDRTHFAEARVQALARHAAEPAFRALCAAVARGLGLTLLEVTPDGLVVLVAEKCTPFTPDVDTLLPSFVQGDERRRQLAVLALLAIVAEVFPTEDSLSSTDDATLILASEVRALLLSRAEAVSREPLPSGSGRELDVRRAFEVVRDVQPSAPSKKTGRESVLGLEGTVGAVLRHLAEHGLLREIRDARDSETGAENTEGARVAYRPTERFAPHVRHLLANDAIDDVLDGLRAARTIGRR